MSDEKHNEELGEKELKDVAGGVQKKAESPRNRELGEDELKRMSGGIQKQARGDNRSGAGAAAGGTESADRED